jgi:hypothetical protein
MKNYFKYDDLRSEECGFIGLIIIKLFGKKYYACVTFLKCIYDRIGEKK